MSQGFHQEAVDLFLDAARGELAIEASGGAGLLLDSPFNSQQPSGRRMQYHTPARFSQQVVQGIRHAAGKLFKVCSHPLSCHHKRRSAADVYSCIRYVTHPSTHSQTHPLIRSLICLSSHPSILPSINLSVESFNSFLACVSSPKVRHMCS